VKLRVKLRFFSTGLLGIPRASEICLVKPLKAIPSQFKFPPPFRLENEQDKREMKLRDVSSRIATQPRAASVKFPLSLSLSRGEGGNNFQHVLEGGGICPPTRRRALNGFSVGAVKRIKTRTDDEGGGPSLPKIRLCIKTPSSLKFAAQWYLTHLTRT